MNKKTKIILITLLVIVSMLAIAGVVAASLNCYHGLVLIAPLVIYGISYFVSKIIKNKKENKVNILVK